MGEPAEFSRADQAGEPTLVVVGEIDLASAVPFGQRLAELIRDARSPAVVDLSGVTFFDSSGINVLVRAGVSAEAAGVDLILQAPSRQVRTVLTLTGLADHFQTRGVAA
jgi:anti-sigma B factor antagonist